MKYDALGMIETKGLVGSIEAADAIDRVEILRDNVLDTTVSYTHLPLPTNSRV